MSTVARSRRWSPISGSANIDTAYRQLWNEPEKAYQYICWCRPPFPASDSESDDEDDGDDEEDGGWEDDDDDDDDEDQSKKKSKKKPKKKRCDGGKTCLCNKPAAEHPDHNLVTTYAGRRKFFSQHSFVQLRDPGVFGMSTYRDHAGFGVMQVIENLLLDFVEADSSWREQWVVCETLGMFLQTDMIDDMMMVNDCEGVETLARLAGRTFLSMLARLEREKLLTGDSEIKNLGLIMSLWAKNAHDLRVQCFDGKPKEETVELTGLDGTTETFTFDLEVWDDYVLGYADRHNITLPGPFNVADAAENCPTLTLGDPWNTAAAFIEYERENGKSSGDRKPTIGGDSLDITTWSSAQRRAASDNGRDPFSKSEIEALKMGLMMGFD